jgi:hypothetical protein
MMDSA